MSSAGRRSGPRSNSIKGRRPRVNRYNPNAPDWNAVHRPWVRQLTTFFKGGYK